MRLLLVTVICFWAIHGLPAQQLSLDSLQQLPEVLVRENANAASSKLTSASLQLGQAQRTSYRNLAEALQDEGLLFLKSYGIGSLATANVRGAAASQTSITWNGIPIQSPMLGLLDLSLLPLENIDAAGINYAGAIGGELYLQNRLPDSTLTFRDALAIGSFGQFRKSLGVSGGRAIRFKINAQFDKAQNNFPYQLTPDSPEKELSNAALQQRATQQTFYWSPAQGHTLEAHLWQQWTQREIPPTTVQTRSTAFQKDRTLRQQLSWKAVGRRAIWNTRLAYIEEDILYADPTILLEAPSDFRSWILQSERSSALSRRSRMSTKLQLQHTNAVANGYRRRRSQQQARLEQAFAYDLIKRFQLKIAGQLQLTEELPTAYGGLLSLGENKSSWKWEALLQRQFRVPSLNDLFWVPGGNPDLQPELSWSQQLVLQKRWPESRTQLQLDVFNRQVDNWIQWAPRDGQIFWSAQNITKVWSRGLVAGMTQAWRWGKLKSNLRMNYQWVKSTYQVAIVTPSLEKGEQLWYTPEHQINTILNISVGPWSTRFGYRYVGATSGVNDDLASYHLGNLQVNWRADDNSRATIFCRIDNLWDTNYRVIERRPMPGRQWTIGYQISFQ